MSVYDFLNSPCAICGYNGAGYWQRETHDRKCPWHYIAGADKREMAMRALMPRFKAEPVASGLPPIDDSLHTPTVIAGLQKRALAPNVDGQ